jgi:hypothetical protein
VGCGVELGVAHLRQGEARVVLDGGARPPAVAPCFSTGGGRNAGWAGWAKRPNRLVGWLGRLLKIISF